MNSHLYSVVPVFNEVRNLPRLLGSFRTLVGDYHGQHDVSIVMIDDGSTDGTAAYAQEFGKGLDLVLLRAGRNQGPGNAFGLAFEYLAPYLTEVDWVLTLEGDNTSRLDLLRQMFQRSQEGYDVVFASPYMYGGGIVNTSPLRVFMSHMANAFVKEFLGAHGILTVSSFYRLYRAPLVMKLQAYYGTRVLEFAGFECMLELLLKMIYIGASISEVPMVLDTSAREGASKMNVPRTIMGYFRVASRTRAWKAASQAPRRAHNAALGAAR
jgi:dolichol-phosphate mannosyltransferase